MDLKNGNKRSPGRPSGARNKPYSVSLVKGDLRSSEGKRFKALVAHMAIDLGGEKFLSAGEQQLIRRCAMISVECERMEQARLGDGAAFDATTYNALTGQLARALRTLGLKRASHQPVPMTLADYVELRQKEKGGAFTVAEKDETSPPETASS
jgi:hypothetical protein